MPTRFCVKKTGPGLSIFIAIATISIGRAVGTIAMLDKTISKNLLMIFLYIILLPKMPTVPCLTQKWADFYQYINIHYNLTISVHIFQEIIINNFVVSAVNIRYFQFHGEFIAQNSALPLVFYLYDYKTGSIEQPSKKYYVFINFI